MIFSWLAFGLPLWSANGSVLDKANQFATAKFGAGVWGICTNVEFTQNDGSATSNAEQCYLYYTSQKVTAFVRDNTNASNINTVDIDDSLCGRWNKLPASDRQDDDNVPAELAVTAKFLRDTCGSLGKATLSMATLAPIFGTLMLVFLILGVTCCKKNSIFVRMGAIFAIFAGIFSVISLALWAQQSKSLHDANSDTNFNASFGLAIAACVLFFIANGTAFAHVAKGDATETETDNANMA